MTKPECIHPIDDASWLAATAPNEDHWICWCGAKLGFRPDIDRFLTFRKVRSILLSLHESKLISISSGTRADVISENVAHRCEKENRYDQKSILRFILEDPNMNPDGTYWQDEAAAWLAAHQVPVA